MDTSNECYIIIPGNSVIRWLFDLTASSLCNIWKCTHKGISELCQLWTDNPKLLNRPTGFTVTVRDVRASAGAGFVVALTGDIMTMPGLPKVPSAEHIDVDNTGKISGLF